MHKLQSVLTNETIPSYIVPLFWQHGEDHDVLREEIRQMHNNGINSFIVESRPHPDFLGKNWWFDLDAIISEAKQLDMKLWIFDDYAFPSGYSAGKIKEMHPEFTKRYLKECHIDAVGPMTGSSFLINAWLETEEKLVCVLIGERLDKKDEIIYESIINVTNHVYDGILYWDLPEGNYRIFILIETKHGGEEHTKDYLNPLEKDAVAKYIEYVYEEHYRHYAKEFGNAIEGFFSDESRFGNASTYEGIMGISNVVLPFSKSLIQELSDEWADDFAKCLPCLWYNGGKMTANIRYTYMNVVSRLYSTNYSMQIGNWCRQHNVKLIGHVVEENGAHARLGYGTGHFFRATAGQDCSGLDVVYNIWPEFTSGNFNSPFFTCDAEFSYWGITKLASSAGHIDPKKNGTTVCEAFGAYGWQAGLKLMKWLTDHICVRGVNVIIPHAFSPKYPDYDCPPHFYARGHNPQWKYFHLWSKYANRVCHLLSGGIHVAPVAVLYHAEFEWGGTCDPFEKAVKIMSQNQIDCDIIPIDALQEGRLPRRNGNFIINGEEHSTIVIPYTENITKELVTALTELASTGINIIFITDYPTSVFNAEDSDGINLLRNHKNITISTYDKLVQKIETLDILDIKSFDFCESLRYYHYVNEESDIYFFTNESKYKTIETSVKFKTTMPVIAYDAMQNDAFILPHTIDNGNTIIDICIEPYQSLFIIFSKFRDDEIKLTEKSSMRNLPKQLNLTGTWRILLSAPEEYPEFHPSSLTRLCNISAQDLLPRFSGTILYESSFDVCKNEISKTAILDLGEVYEIAHVFINGIDVGVCICPPYHFDVSGLLVDGENRINVYVVNTLAKREASSRLDRYMPQEPSGLLGPVMIRY